MNLHYSQTLVSDECRQSRVFLPYEFTLLSNPKSCSPAAMIVFLPYEFTLLSNMKGTIMIISWVFLPYEFTLLSNYS